MAFLSLRYYLNFCPYIRRKKVNKTNILNRRVTASFRCHETSQSSTVSFKACRDFLLLLKDLSHEFEFETLLVKFSQVAYETPKRKKMSIDSLSGYPICRPYKAGPPPSRCIFAYQKLKVKIAGSRQIQRALAGSQRFFFLAVFTISQLEPAKSAASLSKKLFLE